tara:strand:- start:4048 stop:4512 length:465 start_codon:yes stop_codon:yes gene_type:complete
MAKTTFQGVVRSTGGAGKGKAAPGVVVMSEVISFNPVGGTATAVRIGTSSSSGETFVLPGEAVPINFLSLGGATGGTNPTVDIGTADDPDGFFNEVDADTKGTLASASGALVQGSGTSGGPVTVTANQGSSAATGGTVTGVFTYTIADNGKDSE